MAEQMLECDSRLAALKKKYYKKFNKVLPALTVAKFFQLERRVDLMMDMQVESSLPPLTQAKYAGQGEVAWQNRLSNEARCSSTAILIQEHSMFSIMKRHVIVGAMLMSAVMALAQTQVERETLSVQGYQGQATVIRNHGRVFVDVQDLARITKGSLSFEEDRIILTLAPSDASEPARDTATKSGFSPAFMRAAIEAMASIREWGGMLQVIVQNGYPVGKAMAGNTIRAYQGRAADSVALASAAASTDDDHRGLELLRNEFNNVQAWAESFVDARNSLSAVDLTTSENPLKDDYEAQKIMRCGQFLAQMFAGGTFQDDASCH